jgi:predicted branched-subunit amino acid permease
MLPALFLALLLSILNRRQLPVIAVAGAVTVIATLTIRATSGILLGMIAEQVTGTTLGQPNHSPAAAI